MGHVVEWRESEEGARCTGCSQAKSHGRREGGVGACLTSQWRLMRPREEGERVAKELHERGKGCRNTTESMADSTE